MNAATIMTLLKSILPTKKIGAWILGILGAIVALAMGVKNSDLKDTFCASPAVDLPKIEIVAPAPVVTPAPIVAPKPVSK